MDALFNLEMPIMTKSQNVDPAEIKKFEDMASRWCCLLYTSDAADD